EMRGCDRLVGVIAEERGQGRSFQQGNAAFVQGCREYSIRDPGCICVGRSEQGEQLPRVQKSWPFSQARRGPVARPRPVARRVAQAVSHGVQRQVAGKLEEESLVCDEPRAKSALGQMPA